MLSRVREVVALSAATLRPVSPMLDLAQCAGYGRHCRHDRRFAIPNTARDSATGEFAAVLQGTNAMGTEGIGGKSFTRRTRRAHSVCRADVGTTERPWLQVTKAMLLSGETGSFACAVSGSGCRAPAVSCAASVYFRPDQQLGLRR